MRLLLAAPSLHCCMQAFSGCGEWGYSSCGCPVFPLRWLLLLQSTGSGVLRLQWLPCVGSVVVAQRLWSMPASVAVSQGLSCPMACGIFPDQGSNPCPLHWQVDSLATGPPGKPSGLSINLLQYAGASKGGSLDLSLPRAPKPGLQWALLQVYSWMLLLITRFWPSLISWNIAVTGKFDLAPCSSPERGKNKIFGSRYIY